MIDPMVSLAFTVYSNKGAYSLLLGSGISRASGIPTGWEVVLDLVRRVAKMEKEDCEPDPAAWFRGKYNAEPDYSKLLDELAKSPTERQQLLRSYFEPTDEDRREGRKLPSAAHKAIAQLVASGYVRVLLTTNFDRLMEQALDEAGVTHSVISTADQLAGAMPLVHPGVTVIKLHGDYRDTRIKNTDQELAEYDETLNKWLDRILDEYGLIISGWSGDWDIALRAAIERCPTRRFTTYWTTLSPLKGKADALAQHRRAQVVQTKDADHFFTTLQEKVQALNDMSASHPLSPKLAAAAVKRYLVDPTARIRLRDLVHEETEKLFAEITSPAFVAESHLQPLDELLKRVGQYGAMSETLLAILIVGSHWGSDDAVKLWVATLQRIANPGAVSGKTYLTTMRRYPALLLFFGAGIAAVASGNHSTLASLLTKPQAKNKYDQDSPICTVVFSSAVNGDGVWKYVPGLDKRTPVSSHLFVRLREPLREFLPLDEDYQYAFDFFEYLLGLVCADLLRGEYEGGWRGPVGCFYWRGLYVNQDNYVLKKVGDEINEQGGDWPLLKAGLFGGSLEQLNKAKGKFDHFISKLPLMLM